MPTFDESFPALEAALFRQYGHLEPQVEDDLFRAMVSVFLSRSADAAKAAKAISSLNDAGLLSSSTLAEVENLEISETLKASRVSLNVRAVAALKRLASWFIGEFGERTPAPDDITQATSSLREGLASLNGIGPATADALLLYAFQRPAYPVDRASYRILIRHGWTDTSADYAEAQAILERVGEDNPTRLQRLSLGLQRVGREYCKASVPRCEQCPLKPFLPPGGVIEPEGFADEAD